MRKAKLMLPQTLIYRFGFWYKKCLNLSQIIIIMRKELQEFSLMIDEQFDLFEKPQGFWGYLLSFFI
ncbi:hypothetical protein I5M32_15275 [Pedobacter sp. SD-b]|uniref:Uncharacterized protein n=1 Tax=Pedobacter segetis TaxID=2793069 RepID=A0ABS1BN60_9SPHI|nr:hypothetical protein [Pedobacter segetis]MBK0384328.1 hypothetical protein [Pedobacter segetis]